MIVLTVTYNRNKHFPISK